ncbi:hypothetical protein GCM10009801_82160 [Streptomyces albiaxialis]|uniref:Uncharacterized protein n=1 Tax=Streptomyces albiaxialis TaxID=329523 RepID=A0ABN2X7N4_9ACTN
MTQSTWGLGVLQSGDGDRWASVVIEPPDAGQHAELAVRLKAAGLKRLSLREWNGGLWPLSRCSVTVDSGHLAQLHTGRSRVLCQPPAAVTPSWQTAAARGRVLVTLVQAGTLDQDADSGVDLTEGGEAWRGVEDSVRGGLLLGALVELRTTAEPYGRRW